MNIATVFARLRGRFRIYGSSQSLAVPSSLVEWTVLTYVSKLYDELGWITSFWNEKKKMLTKEQNDKPEQKGWTLIIVPHKLRRTVANKRI